ncbi:MAG: DUF3488 domain-containing protein [Myxococcales bacterium]|jgi:Ca2+/Na+ antiporter|nr:DUF3488 domain-containing protein [Myxococcales bacterium]
MRFAATHKVVSYLMVTTAFVMLALTGELPLWLSLLTLLAIGGSFFFDPQRYPLMLGRAYNFSLYAAVLLFSTLLVGSSASAESFWDGGLRVLCLLLVCKLWQRRHNGDYLQAYVVSFVMLLAATFVENSMVYALLLFLYLVFAMWTLTLFHLRREMEENYLLKHLPGRHGQAAESERVEVERILNSRRVVGPPFLLTTVGAGLLTFFLAFFLFLLLPRFHVSIDLPFHRRLLQSTGFSDRLELGSHGLLRDNPRVVMRVEQPGQPPQKTLRLRGVSFAHYENGRWSQRRLGEQILNVQHGVVIVELVGPEMDRKSAKRTEIYLEPLDAGALFTPSPGRTLSLLLPESFAGLTGSHLSVTLDGQIAVHGRRTPLHYAVLSGPTSVPEGSADELAIYRELSPELRLRLRTMALQIVADAATPDEQAERLSSHLQKNYAYTTRLWKPSGGDPIFEFLEKERRGHCEYFATALALLLRSLDIPSRTVNGYLTAEWNRFGQFFVVRQQHAHSWVEVLLPGQGWVVFDPTPPQSPIPRLPFVQELRQLLDGLDMGFGKYVLEYDVSAQQRLSDRLSSLWPRRDPPQVTGSPTSQSSWRKPLWGLVGLGGFGVALLVILRRLRRVEPSSPKDDTEGRGVIRHALTVLRRRGYQRGPGETLQKLADRIADDGDPSAPPFAQLVELYYAHRFGDLPLDRSEVTRLIKQLRALPRRPRPAEPRP